jgi:hypothetical protein
MSDYVTDCPECDAAQALGQRPVPRHYNCLYNGQAMGHRKAGHCTANACY